MIFVRIVIFHCKIKQVIKKNNSVLFIYFSFYNTIVILNFFIFKQLNQQAFNLVEKLQGDHKASLLLKTADL